MKRSGRRLLAVLAIAAVALVLVAARIVPAAALETSGADVVAQSEAGEALGTDGPATGAAGDAAGEKDEAAVAGAQGQEDSSSSDGDAYDGQGDAASSAGAGALLTDLAATDPAAGVLLERIQYDPKTDIHWTYSVPNNDTSRRIILYCMNNLSHWPHDTGSFTAPDYYQGYLTKDKFKSEAEYEACMNKLLAILYAGYPYNGLNMYEVVSQAKGISVEEFNALLDPPAWLRSDFASSLGDAVFSYSDYTNNNTANIKRLITFIQDEFDYYRTGRKTPSGHTSNDIRSLSFYQAALCLAWADTYQTTPLGMYDSEHSGEYYVTEKQAYDATQYAVWAVLGDYGIENNNLKSDSSDVLGKRLALKLLNYATADQVLRAEPDAGDVSISGDVGFAYDPQTDKWKTGALVVSEGANFNGRYAITVPAGISAQTANGTPASVVTAGTEFYLVADAYPTKDVTVTAKATLTWLEEYRQYTPNPENGTASDGKKFQHMIGAVIDTTNVSASTTARRAKEGTLEVKKTVKGEKNSTASFKFTVTLTGADAKLNGTYGDMTFNDGVATFSLADGATKTALHLPNDTTYAVTEEADANYAAAKEGDTGTVATDKTSTATFTNTRLYGLTVQKTVVGKAADKGKAFPITITLKDADGNPASGSYKYTGSVASDAAGAKEPADGTLEFKNGTATVELAHGQRITIAGIPSGYKYTVVEGEHDGYDVSYQGESGTLDHDGASATVTNKLRTGSLKITKRVNGEKHDPSRKFTFTVKLTGAGEKINGTYGNLTFEGGVATVQLGKDESAAATDLPEGTGYTVTEEVASGYESNSENASGTIEHNKTVEVTFTNTLRTITLPLTGEGGVGATCAIGATLLALAAGYLHVRRVAAGKGGDGRD